MYDLGDFDECLKIDEPDNFDPRYWYESHLENDRYLVFTQNLSNIFSLVRISKDGLLMPNQRKSFIQNDLKSVVDIMSMYEDEKEQLRIIPTEK